MNSVPQKSLAWFPQELLETSSPKSADVITTHGQRDRNGFISGVNRISEQVFISTWPQNDLVLQCGDANKDICMKKQSAYLAQYVQGLSERQALRIIQIANNLFGGMPPKYNIVFGGSRVRGDHLEGSGLDIALDINKNWTAKITVDEAKNDSKIFRNALLKDNSDYEKYLKKNGVSVANIGSNIEAPKLIAYPMLGSQYIQPPLKHGSEVFSREGFRAVRNHPSGHVAIVLDGDITIHYPNTIEFPPSPNTDKDVLDEKIHLFETYFR